MTDIFPEGSRPSFFFFFFFFRHLLINSLSILDSFLLLFRLLCSFLQALIYSPLFTIMRFVVVPLSTKNAFIFCQQRVAPPILVKSQALTNRIASSNSNNPDAATLPVRNTPRIDDRIVDKAQQIWGSWERSPARWKQAIVRWANVALEKIPYDEYSLKSIPSKSRVLKKIEDNNQSAHVSIKHLEKIQHNVDNIHPVEVLYPARVFSQQQSLDIMRRLAVVGEQQHWKYFLVSLGLSPLTLPLSLLPVFPNLPGIYLLYRAWSNYKAFEGAKHLRYLIEQDQLEFKDCASLNESYSSALEAVGAAAANEKAGSTDHEVVILNRENIKQVEASVEATSELSAELLRAVHQVQKRLDTAHN